LGVHSLIECLEDILITLMPFNSLLMLRFINLPPFI
jgi:hypothetical protein